MDFTALVKYIKTQGCRVRIYKNCRQVDGNIGTFHVATKGPLISLATKGCTKKKRVEYLLHEFSHFLQWREGYMQTLDGICDSYHIWDQWIKEKIELTPLEWQVARNSMLAIEWDAEYRAYELGQQLNAKHFDPEYHLKGANAYMLGIKWSWLYRFDFNTAPKRKKIKPRVLTKKQLFAPLTRREKEFLKDYQGT